MRFHPIILAALMLLQPATSARPEAGKTRPPEVPAHLEASAPNQNLAAAKAVTVTVTSHSAEDPADPQEIERLRKRTLKALPAIPWTVTPDAPSARLSLEFVIEPHLRYGLFHYQIAPYYFLTLRDAPTGHLVYCAYRRAGHLRSASERLLHDLQHTVQHPQPPPPDSLEACAQQARRPL